MRERNLIIKIMCDELDIQSLIIRLKFGSINKFSYSHGFFVGNIKYLKNIQYR